MPGLVIALSLLVSAPTPSARREAIIIMNEGVDFASQGDNAKAKAKLQAATKADPTYAYAWLNLGIVLERDGDGAGAKAAFEAGLPHARDEAVTELQFRVAKATYETAVESTGSHAQQRQAVEQALELLGKVTKATPERSDAHLYRAFCHEHLDQPTEADAEYRAAIEADSGNVDAFVRLANLYIDYGHANAGIAVLDAATKTHATNVEAWSGLGRAYLALDKPQEAVDALKKAITIDPEHLRNQFALGMAYADLRDRKLAVERLEEFLRLADLADDEVPESMKIGANQTIARMRDVL